MRLVDGGRRAGRDRGKIERYVQEVSGVAGSKFVWWADFKRNYNIRCFLTNLIFNNEA